jgi:hypothetical protein
VTARRPARVAYFGVLVGAAGMPAVRPARRLFGTNPDAADTAVLGWHGGETSEVATASPEVPFSPPESQPTNVDVEMPSGQAVEPMGTASAAPTAPAVAGPAGLVEVAAAAKESSGTAASTETVPSAELSRSEDSSGQAQSLSAVPRPAGLFGAADSERVARLARLMWSEAARPAAGVQAADLAAPKAPGAEEAVRPRTATRTAEAEAEPLSPALSPAPRDGTRAKSQSAERTRSPLSPTFSPAPPSTPAESQSAARTRSPHARSPIDVHPAPSPARRRPETPRRPVVTIGTIEVTVAPPPGAQPQASAAPLATPAPPAQPPRTPGTLLNRGGGPVFGLGQG